MKKRLLAAAVLASLTLSTAAALAATPSFSGDANIEYNNGDVSPDYLTNRIRLSTDAQIDDTFYIHGRMKMVNDLRDNDGVTTGFDQAYIGAETGVTDIRVGRQSLFIGKGLLMDEDNFTGALVTTSVPNLNVQAFYGKDAAGDSYASQKTSFIDLGTSYGGVNFGATYLKEGDKFFAVNADTKIAPNATLNVEYAKNDTLDADGFIAGVTFGNAVKKGDFAYTVAYHDIEDGAIAEYTTNANFKDSKGVLLKGSYKVSDRATLTAYHDAAETQLGADKARTNVEFTVNF